MNKGLNNTIVRAKSRTFIILLLIVFGLFVVVSKTLAQGIDSAGLSIPKVDASTVQKVIEAVKGAFNAALGWLMDRGIDIAKIIHLMGELIVVMVQAVIKMVEWIVGLVR